MEDELGISVRFIRAFDPTSVQRPTAFDRKLAEAFSLAAFLAGAPDYDPAQHDALIWKTVFRRLNRSL